MNNLEKQPDYSKISSEFTELLHEFKIMDDFNRKRESSKYNDHTKQLRKVYGDLNKNMIELKDYIGSIEKYYKNKKNKKNEKNEKNEKNIDLDKKVNFKKTLKGGDINNKDENNNKKSSKIDKMIKNKKKEYIQTNIN